MGYKTFDRAEEKYQAEVKRLDKIAQHVFRGNYGYLLRTLAKSWLLADSSDRRIIKPAWSAIVTKYSLSEEAGV